MRRPIGTTLREVVFADGRTRPEDSTEESGLPSRYRERANSPGVFMSFMGMKGTVQGYCALYLGVFFEKC